MSSRVVVDAFREQVQRHPDHTAVEADDVSLTFAELARQAIMLADELTRAGVGRGEAVAVSLPRTSRLIVAMLATWQVGAAFVLIDPGEPLEAKEYKYQLVDAVVYLCEEADPTVPAGARMLVYPRPAPGRGTVGGRALRSPAPADRAYYVFTSGSTGRPKGVTIDHGSLMHHCRHQLTDIYAGYSDGEPLRIASAAPVYFDSFLDQFLPMLLFGHTMVLLGDAQRFDLERYVAGPGFDVVDCAPSQLELLVRHGLLEGEARPRLIVFGGENPSAHLWSTLRDHQVEAYSVYGVTECSIGTLTAPVLAHEHVSLGRPTLADPVYVLRPGTTALVEVGEVGEIVIGGGSVGVGYLGEDPTGGGVFTPDPFGAPGETCYRTGDLGRLMPDGSITFVERLDDQIKVRGFRIEPVEVERTLLTIPGIRVAVALGDVHGSVADRLLVGYVDDENRPWTEIKPLLAERCPKHLMPDWGVALSEVPITDTGKIDRQELRRIIAASHEGGEDDEDVNSYEDLIRQIWKDVLGVDRLRVTTPLVDLGATSIMVLDIAARVADLPTPAPIDFSQLLAATTIREQAMSFTN